MNVDLLDFAGEDLYFDKPMSPELASLLSAAAESYGTPAAEPLLLKAYFLASENFSVLVALYRFFYYQHRYEDALRVAERALRAAADGLGINRDWRALSQTDLAFGVRGSMALMRFHLYVLKGSGYLLMRMDRLPEALERLEKVVALDTSDRIGAQGLVEIARQALGDVEAVSA